MGQYGNNMTKIIIITLTTILLQACVTTHKIKAPTPPIIKPVNVTNHCVCGQDLDNLIDNWIDLGEAYKKCLSTGDFK